MNSELENNLSLGLAHCKAKAWDEAVPAFEAVLAIDPRHAIAWNNLGNVRDELGDATGAMTAYNAALGINPDYDSAKTNLAIVAHQHGQAAYAKGNLAEALRCFEIASGMAIGNADYDHSYLQLLLETCQHGKITALVMAMQARCEVQPDYRLHPYPLLACVDAPLWHLAVAKRHTLRLLAKAPQMLDQLPAQAKSARTRRIRIAYLSSDWHQHPVPQQLLPSIEAHDRGQFEVIGIATDAAPDTTAWRLRIERAFEHFHPLGHLTDAQIADELRSLDIDIAIDLSLYMEGGRPLILASRPCRVQIAFLGYAGTSGAPWIDYLIADEVTIPPSHDAFYSEKIIRLATGSFMPDNDQRPPVRSLSGTDRAAARLEHGLPADAFVFCAFSNPYKITPDMLACWLNILHSVPNSVLWLQANNDVAQHNLATAAQATGIAQERIIFAKRVPGFAAHVQRYALADLFLDTYPYNAHVTAADTLWAGLPVLTLQGESFASRVASSILTALGLPGLVTTNKATYATRAIALASDKAQLKTLRLQLASSIAAGLYFNETKYVRALESALLLAATPPSLKLIAFSLWGTHSMYLEGALRNAQLAAKHYPDWVCRFYCASDIADDFLQHLQSHTNVQIVLMPPEPERGGAFWRFLAAQDARASHILFRDTDSRLSQREAAAVDEWMVSGKTVHLMRDHPFHWTPIMAGMWGCKGGAMIDWQAQLAAYAPSHEYGADQAFLSDVIYPIVKSQCLIHDAFALSEAHLDIRPFPTPRQGLEFVGQCYDEHDQPNLYYEQELTAVARL